MSGKDNEKTAELSELERTVVEKVLFADSTKDLPLNEDERRTLRNLLSSGGVIINASNNGELSAKKRID